MIFSDDGFGWSQSGQIYIYSLGCARHFAEQEQNSNLYPPTNSFGVCVSTGEVHWVWQQFLSDGSGHVRANIDTTVLAETNYNVYASESNGGWRQPFQVQVEGETNYPESDVPGTDSQRSDFTNMEVQSYPSATWRTACNGAVFNDHTTLSRYMEYPPSCDHVQVWTLRPSGP